MEEYFAQLQEANVSADTYSRPMTENETARLEELRQAYLEQGYFPKKELTLIDNPENTKGSGFLCGAEYLFLPEKELTDEQLLELIDFKEKREYSLAKISEEIEAGSYEYVKTEPERMLRSRDVQHSRERVVRISAPTRQHRNGRWLMRET